jgi:hypothetical protein
VGRKSKEGEMSRRKKDCIDCKYFIRCKIDYTDKFQHYREPDKRQWQKMLKEKDFRYCKGYRYRKSPGVKAPELRNKMKLNKSLQIECAEIK